MHTPHQFLLLSSPPAKEAAFQEAKKKHGSTFAFHGSSIENWHSIIRYTFIIMRTFQNFIFYLFLAFLKDKLGDNTHYGLSKGVTSR
jgi:hypothetical protein